jgi:hypothetical protein
LSEGLFVVFCLTQRFGASENALFRSRLPHCGPGLPPGTTAFRSLLRNCLVHGDNIFLTALFAFSFGVDDHPTRPPLHILFLAMWTFDQVLTRTKLNEARIRHDVRATLRKNSAHRRPSLQTRPARGSTLSLKRQCCQYAEKLRNVRYRAKRITALLPAIPSPVSA